MRTRELARSVEELKALGEVGQAVSSTLELETVLARIASHAVQLSGADGEQSTNTKKARRSSISEGAIRSKKSWLTHCALARSN